MTSRLTELSVDCHDPRAVAAFWCAVLGYRILSEEEQLVEIGIDPLTPEIVRPAPIPPTIVFVVVPEDKVVKNRMHIDVNPIDATQEEEVERLIALGARRVDIGQGDVHWVVMADPEGNEFCVLSSLKSP
jgi:glyoxalase superfamily protein